MKLYNLLTGLLLYTAVSCVSPGKSENSIERQDWKLSMQSYTFHFFSVVESLEKCKELGVHYIEIYPGQRMGEGFGDAVFGYDLTADQQNRLKKLAESQKVKIISSGVWTPRRDEWEKVFAFAESMGLEFVSAEPARSDWGVVEELAIKTGIKVACHNHPNENSYWKPEILLQHIGDKSSLLGACADVGHFKRMGVNAISALSQLEGRMIALHFKDIKPQDPDGVLEDTVWGTGDLNVKGMLKELKRQNFKGYFIIEYEANWGNNLPEIKQSIDYFNVVADEIL